MQLSPLDVVKDKKIKDCPAEDQIERVSWLIVITSDAYTGSWMNLGGAQPQIYNWSHMLNKSSTVAALIERSPQTNCRSLPRLLIITRLMTFCPFSLLAQAALAWGFHQRAWIIRSDVMWVIALIWCHLRIKAACRAHDGFQRQGRTNEMKN